MGFALPFNGTDAASFIEKLAPYKNDIDYIYVSSHDMFFDIDRVMSYLANKSDARTYFKNCEEFISMINHDEYKLILDVSNPYIAMNSNGLYGSVKSFLFPYIRTHHFAGARVADIALATVLRQEFGDDFELHIVGQYNLHGMHYCDMYLNANQYELPVDTLRNRPFVEYLKNVKNDVDKNIYNFFFEAIVNDNNPYGSFDPGYQYKRNYRIVNKHIADYADIYETLRGNWVLPRWLKHYDDIVDTYIIKGLYEINQDRLFSILDAYVNQRDDIVLQDIIDVKTDITKPIPVTYIQNKLNRCASLECNISCNSCIKKIADLLDGNIESE
jgi:hypothetical protein